MTTENAKRCDATGCKAKTFEPTDDGYVAKGWTHARITTRAGIIEVDFCEKHSQLVHAAIGQVNHQEDNDAPKFR